MNTTTSIPPIENQNLQISATNPLEMQQAQEAAIAWCKNKIVTVQAECDELITAWQKAVKSKWNPHTLKRHSEIAAKRCIFFRKILAALEAGYHIVPNFPVTLFAIRTDKPTPKRNWVRLRYQTQHNFQQEAEVLPQGEGEYKDPQPVVEQNYESLQKKQINSGYTEESWNFRALDWDGMEFPINLARPVIMEAATRAMDLKIFDEVGFLPEDHRRNPDPVLVGRILDPKVGPYRSERRVISFLIAWAIDTRTI